MNEVPYPPPPAQVESIPPPKNPDEVWLDGQWDWDGKAWKWLAGAWAVPPENAYFSPWATKRRPDGQLLFVRGTWRDQYGRPLDAGDGAGVCGPPETTAAKSVR